MNTIDNPPVPAPPPSSASSPTTPEPAPVKLFWLEPAKKTLIGTTQNINIFVALKNNADDPYPAYLSATDLTWASSNPAVASIGTNGVVTGLTEGSTIITAKYRDFSDSLEVQVSGQMLSRSINIPGQGLRKYSIYIPTTNSLSAPLPMLLSLHGGGGTAALQASSSQLNQIANDKKFFAVYPEGTGAIQTFNSGACCGITLAQTTIDDSLFIRTLINDLTSKYLVNSSKIFATGFSNGAIMSHRLACELSDIIAGIAPVAGGSGEFDFELNQYYTCNPARPIPVLHIHHSNDRNYPIDGGFGEGSSGTNFYSIKTSINDWIRRNNLTNDFIVENVTSTTKCFHYSVPKDPGIPSAKVSLCQVTPVDNFDSVNSIVFGGGHSWPGGVRSPSPSSDTPVSDFQASSYIWNFLNP